VEAWALIHLSVDVGTTRFASSRLIDPRTARSFAATLMLAIVASSLAAATTTAAPRAFFGVVPQGPLERSDFDLMRGTVGTLRIPVTWSNVEPRPGEYDFAALDEAVLSAAAAGIQVLPFVGSSPDWVASDPAKPPLHTRSARLAWTGFLQALVRRYGPSGDIWTSAPSKMPIHSWQIWNEPNYVLGWHPHPVPREYVRLLRISARALRKADRHVRVIAAGLAPVTAGISPLVFLGKMYAIPGARRSFDAVALHPYAVTLSGVAYQVRVARRVMALAGDRRKPLFVTELGVASNSAFPTAYDKGPEGQALFLRQAMGLLSRERHRWHIGGVDWFTWRDYPAADRHCVFCQYAGLLSFEGRPKPAWYAFRRVVCGPLRSASLDHTCGSHRT
jgi:hypothetical protein